MRYDPGPTEIAGLFPTQVFAAICQGKEVHFFLTLNSEFELNFILSYSLDAWWRPLSLSLSNISSSFIFETIDQEIHQRILQELVDHNAKSCPLAVALLESMVDGLGLELVNLGYNISTSVHEIDPIDVGRIYCKLEQHPAFDESRFKANSAVFLELKNDRKIHRKHTV